MESRSPLVTVCVPVRNGERTLRRALQNILDQTYTNLEIIVSDNCSSDETPSIIAEFAARDPRVTALRQPRLLTAWNHFFAVAGRAEGDYLMWAADDDIRNETYIEQLVHGLQQHPVAGLAFGSVIPFYEDDDPEKPITSLAHDYSWDGESRFAQIAELFRKCARMYGVFRTVYVREYPWMQADTEYGPDVAFLLYARMRGDFISVPGAVFYQAVPRGTYRAATRAQDHYFKAPPRFALVRLAWCCMKSAAIAARLDCRPPRRVRALLLSYSVLKIDHTKIWLFPRLPAPLVTAWRRLRPVSDRDSSCGATSNGVTEAFTARPLAPLTW